MDPKSQRSKDQEGAISALNAAIDVLNLAKTSSIALAETVFGSVSTLLATTMVCFPLFCNGLLQAHA